MKALKYRFLDKSESEEIAIKCQFLNKPFNNEMWQCIHYFRYPNYFDYDKLIFSDYADVYDLSFEKITFGKYIDSIPTMYTFNEDFDFSDFKTNKKIGRIEY